MKYTNSQKYITGFPKMQSGRDISFGRIKALCEALGRINLGFKYICVPEDASGHTCACLLEETLRRSGYRVGRISSSYGLDYNNSVFFSQEADYIDVFCKAVTELKSAIAKCDGDFYREEIVFALDLLLCKLFACDFVILEGMSGEGFTFDAVCAPYELVLMPTLYDSENYERKISPLCDAIRRGTKEVVSGNQRSEIFNFISTACANSGVRLCIPAKAQLSVTELGIRKRVFDYGDKTGYLLRSPSIRLCDCALAVIEAASALRRRGIKIPQASLCEAFENVSRIECFEVISASPNIIIDYSETKEECELLLKTAEGVGVNTDRLSLCVALDKKHSIEAILSAFEGREITRLTLLDQDGIYSSDPDTSIPTEVFDNAEDAARSAMRSCEDVLICLGSVKGTALIRPDIIKIMNKMM